MKILHLTLKKKWYDMIQSGEKKEEYREQKHYWLSRLKYYCNYTDMMHEFEHDYTHVLFRNGYSKDAPKMLVKLEDTRFGKAKPEWSDNWQGEVIVLSLGNVLAHTGASASN